MKRRNMNIGITVFFLGFLFSASVVSVWYPKRGFSPSENRYLQQKPEFTWKGLLEGSFGEDYEVYLSDQFPARDGWIGVKVRAERLQQKQDVNDVYFAKHGYLIEKFNQEDLTGDQLDKNIHQVTEFLNSAAKSLGEDHVRVMMIPSASQILQEKLPAFAADYDQKKIIERIRGLVSEKMVVPVDEVLTSHREEEIYYKTDHHWTALGAYYGYQSWAESIGLIPWKQDEFQIKTVSENFLGTIYSKVNVPVKPDSIQLYLPKEEQYYEVFYDGSEEMSDSLYSYSALQGKDQYMVYLDGNHGLTEIINPKVTEDRKGSCLLIVKDSYAHSFAPFAVNHFERVFMIDLRYFNLNVQKFARENGVTDTLVLYQIPRFSVEKTIRFGKE